MYHIPQEWSPWDKEICHSHVVSYFMESLGAWAPPPPPPRPRSLDHWGWLEISALGGFLTVTPEIIVMY